jgi:hypothetical protein
LCTKRREYAWMTNRLIPMRFAWQPAQHILRWVAAGQPHFSVDKTRALMLVASLIKRGMCRMPPLTPKTLLVSGHWESLILVQRTEIIGTANLLVTREGRRPDDFCSAMSMGCLAAWHKAGTLAGVCAELGISETGAGSILEQEAWEDDDEDR